VCFAVPEKEVKAVAEALKSRFRQALEAGRLSQVINFDFLFCMVGYIVGHWFFLFFA
jgi:hypothetical protein